MADYYEQLVRSSENPRHAANWVLSELLRELKNANLEITECPVKAEDLGSLIKLINKNTVSGKMAKEIFEKMFQTGKAPKKIIDELGLSQITDPTVIREAIAKAIADNPKQVENYCG